MFRPADTINDDEDEIAQQLGPTTTTTRIISDCVVAATNEINQTNRPSHRIDASKKG